MRRITNQFAISQESHAARLAFSATALVRNHDDRHGERFIELSNGVLISVPVYCRGCTRGFASPQEPRDRLIKAPSQQSSLLLLAAGKFRSAM
jgi:hypothetical protein